MLDINDLRGLLTAVLLFSFIALCIWAWSGRRKADFDAQAALPLEEDESMRSNNREDV